MPAVIGIVPTASLFDTDDPHKDQYLFVNNYIQRIVTNGGVPVGVLSADGHAATEAFGFCNGFLLCGGHKLWPYHLQVVEHAVQTGKPILGICLGMQAICAYFRVREAAIARGFAGNTLELFDIMKKEGFMFNLPVENHWKVAITRTNVSETKHMVDIYPGTRLYSLLGRQVSGTTLHRYMVNGLAEGLEATAFTADGTIEGIEGEPGILGVQFHPEVDGEMDPLFRDLIARSRS